MINVSLNFAIILYFCISHFFLIGFLIFAQDKSFNQKLAECYIWPLFLTKTLHDFFSKWIVYGFNHVSNGYEYVKDGLMHLRSKTNF